MMTELLTAAQMRALERAAIDSGAVTGLELMERAGQGVVAAILEEWPELGAAPSEGALPPSAMQTPPEYLDQEEGEGAGGLLRRAVVLCGPGNNGGDGFVVARLLKESGWAVEVFALTPPMSADALAMATLWAGEIGSFADLDWPLFRQRPLVVDAVFGAGLSRDIAPGVWGALSMAQSCRCRMVAVDIPSGLCADSGRIRSQGGWLEQPFDLTVSFERPRLGHHLSPAADLCGRLVVVPLGLETQLEEALRADTGEIVDLARAGGGLGKAAGHKFSHGHALILSGPPGRGGAARLAARGALRIGAGVVTLGCPRDAIPENAARLDAVMLREVLDGAALTAGLEDKRINALCLGPGMGLGAREAGLVAAALALGRRMVLDADALTLLSRDAALFGALHEGCVLTPHAGEFARLFPGIAAKLAEPAMRGPAYSKVDACREAAALAGCVVLFKGADTVIAAPDGRCAVNSAAYERAAPWLATAGAGDVLAGFITGLLARGFDTFGAACTGAWLHVECARSFGPGLIAEDLPEELPKVFRTLGL